MRGQLTEHYSQNHKTPKASYANISAMEQGGPWTTYIPAEIRGIIKRLFKRQWIEKVSVLLNMDLKLMFWSLKQTFKLLLECQLQPELFRNWEVNCVMDLLRLLSPLEQKVNRTLRKWKQNQLRVDS